MTRPVYDGTRVDKETDSLKDSRVDSIEVGVVEDGIGSIRNHTFYIFGEGDVEKVGI